MPQSVTPPIYSLVWDSPAPAGKLQAQQTAHGIMVVLSNIHKGRLVPGGVLARTGLVPWGIVPDLTRDTAIDLRTLETIRDLVMGRTVGVKRVRILQQGFYIQPDRSIVPMSEPRKESLRPPETRPCATCGKAITRRPTLKDLREPRWYCGYSCLGKRPGWEYHRNGGLNISRAARVHGVKPTTALQRIHLGWDVERAVSELSATGIRDLARVQEAYEIQTAP